MTMRNSLAVAIAAAITAVFLSVAVQPVKAATINWGAAQNIIGDTDVITTGSLFASANFGTGTSVIVNTVTFDPFTASGTTTTVGNITLTSTTGQSLSNVVATFGGPASYNGLLESASFVAPGSPATSPRAQSITLSNLLVGATYSIQYWVNDSRGGTTASRTVGVGTQTLDVNVSETVGGFGQYTIGQFLADSTTQSFSVFGNPNAAEADAVGASYANAMQVRMVAVPEQSTWVMAGAGIALVATCGEVRRRRRVRALAS